MEGLWDRNEAGDWPWHAQVKLIEHAIFLAQPAVLSTLLKPPEERTDLAAAELALAGAAERFLEVIEEFPDAAARLRVGADEFTAEIDPNRSIISSCCSSSLYRALAAKPGHGDTCSSKYRRQVGAAGASRGRSLTVSRSTTHSASSPTR